MRDRAIPKIERHKAAIARGKLSRPVRLAVEADILKPETTFFDYGCGRGDDMKYLGAQGYTCGGWDPHYCPDTPRIHADIVNLGYILNVIECQSERREALISAWELARQVLIVSAQVLVDTTARGWIPFGDGVVTSHNTFQKYYEQEELKTYIDQVLKVDAIPVALGIYLVFRNEAQAQTFRAFRFHRRISTPRVHIRINHFEEYRELLAPLMNFVTERGRLPVKGELSTEHELVSQFGSLLRAFQVIVQATGNEEWEAIQEKRRQDLLVFLALSQFGHRPKFKDLALEAQLDIKALLDTYKKACETADRMLFQLGESGFIAERCQLSKVGKLYGNGLHVHISALEELDPLLRIYEGCASRTVGRMEDTTLIKFHTNKPMISYLCYPDFDTDPHPVLKTSMQIDLRKLHVTYMDYEESDDPHILHRKESFVLADYPLYAKFMKLSQQEEAWGLLDKPGTIGKRSSWLRCLEEHCADLQGHRLVWRNDADPYNVKLLRSAQRSRLLKTKV
jgi:DNA phosphorothioation-associated putative methyltransferase